jgi:hypothetical protein
MSVVRKVLVAVAVGLAPLLSLAGESAAAGGTPVTWTIQPPSAPYPTSFISGISCASASWCVAVGNTNTNTVFGALAEVWNGKSWSVMTNPQPSASGAQFKSVSCIKAPAPTPSPFCMAVGAGYVANGDELPMAEAWNGTKWTVVTPIKPSTAYLSWLQSVSCTSPQFCMAVGQTRYGDTEKMLTEEWNGTKWGQEAPAPIKDTYDTNFTSVSCVSVHFCNAVGSYIVDGGEGQGASEEIWKGKGWFLVGYNSPVTAAGIQLWGISCASVTYCVSVGYYWDSNSENAADVADLEWWNGVTWKVIQRAYPTGENWSELETVSCVAVQSCVAAGDWSRSSYGDAYAYAETLTGDGASATTSLPNPPNATLTSPNAVSCPAAGSCMTDGFYDTAGGNDLGFAESEHSGTWSLDDLVNPPGIVDGNLNSVSCTSESACVSVGYYPFGESWNGKVWTTSSLPSPAGTDDPRLVSVSCPASKWCIAVGNYYGSGGTDAGSDTWNGKDWSVVDAPSPTGEPDSELNAVTCKSADDCLALGSYFVQGQGFDFGEVWNGKQWHTVTTPEGGDLVGVSCMSADSCLSVGGTGDSNTAEAWNGSSWSVLSGVPQLNEASFTGVSCTTTACMAVGGYVTSGGVSQPEAYSWNGSTWKSTSPPGAVKAEGTYLSSVSCSSDSSCEADGSYSDQAAGSQSRSFVESWNGQQWTVGDAPNPPGALSSSLEGVSCVSATWCIAVGGRQYSNGTPLTYVS